MSDSNVGNVGSEPVAGSGASQSEDVAEGTSAARRIEPGDDDAANPTVSVVVVTYNEADRISRCLDSVFELCEGMPFEVILVDSNSSDGTVDIAREYPITVLQIPSDDLSTPSAGRYVGTHAADGEFVLFVDGDMDVTDGWLPRACDLLRERPDVAAVDGHLNENRDHDEVVTVGAVRGVALYDAQKLRTVGGFDPFLRSLEDIDLGFRLGESGYRLCRLPVVVAEHPVASGPTEPLRRLRNGYVTGAGQAIRKSTDSPRRLVRHLRRMRNKLLVGAWGALGAFSLLSPPLLVGWLVMTAAGFYALASEKGFTEAVSLILGQMLTLCGIIWGFRDPPRPAIEYPLDRIETVQVADPSVHTPAGE
ncbi:glycosyltransferase [Halopelagius longus]|uniref:Glycosyltransferase family 2 protein n=1 Tax=Halopelagius longus TaxID=1236180 RepID=A0A1H1GIX7_9EURY|nr:glycosyltransferase family A protein [Halopelagius longus]RDI69714.1 glycosyltransferase family 2 protein [Halopelagius longus]SDR13131.1 Glycosyltransferase, catalytic subunit of cellulose synthase and poly-beta-1,6-N-acetylglucosamine synthase [Halopelagius longus]